MQQHEIIIGDVIDGLRSLPTGSVHCCVTSPPYYGLRDYGMPGQIGLEDHPEKFIRKLTEVFAQVSRVLRPDGTCWVNMGDSYAASGRGGGGGSFQDKDVGKKITNKNSRRAPVAGLKEKDLCGIPWRLAFALRDAGWYLRQDIIWAKPNPMPESVTDRCTKAHEYLFLLSNSARYYYDAEAIKEGSADLAGSAKRYASAFFVGAKHESGGYSPTGATQGSGMKKFDGMRNRRSVWTIATQSTKEAHFATFPEALVVPCILAGTSEKGVCSECGAPWVRIVEHGEKVSADGRPNPRETGWHETNGSPASEVGKLTRAGHMVIKKKTTGWQPSCDCNAGIVPAVVLDPFLGSGTTLAVAKKIGRHGIGCELNPEYAEIARRRIARARIGDVEKFMKHLANKPIVGSQQSTLELSE